MRTRRRIPSAWNTVGPFFPTGLLAPSDGDLTVPGASGQRPMGEIIEVAGRVLELNARPAVNIVIELWQANAAGRYNHPHDNSNRPLDAHFTGFGRTPTDSDGGYGFTTIMPGGYEDDVQGTRAPHLNLSLLGSGLMRRLSTRMYFFGEEANARDALLASLPEQGLRERLIARPAENATERRRFVFDIVLRGEDETPFFVD